MEEKKIYDSRSEPAALWVNRRAHADMQVAASTSNHSHGVYVASRSEIIAWNNGFIFKKNAFVCIFQIYNNCLNDSRGHRRHTDSEIGFSRYSR